MWSLEILEPESFIWLKIELKDEALLNIQHTYPLRSSIVITLSPVLSSLLNASLMISFLALLIGGWKIMRAKHKPIILNLWHLINVYNSNWSKWSPIQSVKYVQVNRFPWTMPDCTFKLEFAAKKQALNVRVLGSKSHILKMLDCTFVSLPYHFVGV